MTGSEPEVWHGCHGVRATGAESERFGLCQGEPLATVQVRLGRPAGTGPRELWSQQLPNGDIQRFTEHPSGDVVLEIGPGHRVSLSPGADAVTTAEPSDWVATQLVASFIFPFLVSGDRALVLHAAAACRSGAAVVIAGPGGTGKSSSLVALAEAGWTPLSEDVCVLDLAGPLPVVWPGPPWVRRLHGEPGPRGSTVLFESSEKTAWDLGGFRHAPGPTPVREVLIVQPPEAGVVASRTRLHPGDAIRAVAAHAVWLGDARESGRHLFGGVAEVAARIPVSAVRMPRSDTWTESLLRLVG